MNFAENFRRICRAKGTSATAVLTELGVTASKLTLWKNTIPRQELLIQLAQKLECTVSDLFSETYPANTDEDILRLYNSLTDENKHRLIAQAYRLGGTL